MNRLAWLILSVYSSITDYTVSPISYRIYSESAAHIHRLIATKRRINSCSKIKYHPSKPGAWFPISNLTILVKLFGVSLLRLGRGYASKRFDARVVVACISIALFLILAGPDFADFVSQKSRILLTGNYVPNYVCGP